jgi:hypothetical protein
LYCRARFGAILGIDDHRLTETVQAVAHFIVMDPIARERERTERALKRDDD